MSITVYVVFWRYGDNSDSGVVSVHATEIAANVMRELLSAQGSIRLYSVKPAPSDAWSAA